MVGHPQKVLFIFVLFTFICNVVLIYAVQQAILSLSYDDKNIIPMMFLSVQMSS